MWAVTPTGRLRLEEADMPMVARDRLMEVDVWTTQWRAHSEADEEQQERRHARGQRAKGKTPEQVYGGTVAQRTLLEGLRERVMGPTKREDGIPPNQIEYKTRRLVNDYLQPPKVTRKYELGQARLAEVREDMQKGMMVRNSHELMRSLEAASILDCADMAAHASLYREESRWGLYHWRTDYAGKDNDNWFCHTLLSKKDGAMFSEKHPVADYVVPIADDEKDLYDKQRVTAAE